MRGLRRSARLGASISAVVMVAALAGAPPAAAVVDVADVGVTLNATSQGLLTQTVVLTATLTNYGPAEATETQVRMVYPAQFRLVDAPECAPNTETRIVTCNLGTLPVGSSASKQIRVRAKLLTVGLPVAFTATRSYSLPPEDGNPANDEASDTCLAITSLLVSC